jgi:hypothetical protein
LRASPALLDISEMDQAPDNPYLPPKVAEPESYSRTPWRIQNGELWIRNGAYLPRFDLLTGEPAGASSKIKKVSLMPTALLPLFLSVFLGGHLLQEWVGEGRMADTVGLAKWGLVWLISWRWGTVAWTIAYDENPQAFGLKLKKLKWFVLFGIAATLGFASVPPLFKQNLSWFKTGDSVALLVLAMSGIAIALAIAAVILTRRSSIVPCSVSGEWARLRGVSPQAITYLKSLPPAPEYPSDKSSRTYLIRLAKFRWFDWCRFLGWKFLPCVRIGVAKWIHPHRLNSRGLLRLEQVDFKAAEDMAESFRGSVRELSLRLETGGWRFSSWHKTEVPDRSSTVIQEASFVHQDGRDRLAIYHALSGVSVESGMDLHAWLPDGTVLLTSNKNALPVMNPGVEWDQQPQADITELIERHQVKSASRGAIAFTDPAEMEQRLIDLNLENHRCLHAKGIYGPLEAISA